MNTCPQCGVVLRENARFCLSCGAQLPAVVTFAAGASPQVEQPAVAPPETTAGAPSEMERALARTKSYTGAAIAVFVLYSLAYLPGLIFNLMYLREARRMEQIAGQELPGTGCLSSMVWAGVLVFIALVLFLMWFFGTILGGRLF
jgi:hypothetical protein